MGVFSFIFGIFGKRPEPEKKRGTVVYQSPDEPPVPAEMERHVGIINAALETFDGTSDINIKADQLPIIERELAEILRLEPESSAAHRLQAMLPGIKAELYHQAAEPPDPSIDEMRQGLQKVAYGMVGKGVSSDEKARFKQDMTEFASADPLVREIAERVRDLVAETPGLLQSKIYGNFPEYDKEQVRYALYFANELGLVHRKKKGNSYELFPPGTVINMEVPQKIRIAEEMPMKNLDLMERYAEQHLGHPLEQAQPVKLNGDQVSEVLWPLNDLFRPNLAAIQSFAYDARYEPEADAAIAGFAFAPDGYDWSTLSSGAWRVFMERHFQTLMLAGLQQQTPLLSVPLNLPERARLGFLLLFQYHEMPLPFPVQDRSSAELPLPNASGNLLRH